MENSNHLTESWSLSWQSVLSSQLWRLEHLYWIENKAGQLQRFSLNRRSGGCMSGCGTGMTS